MSTRSESWLRSGASLLDLFCVFLVGFWLAGTAFGVIPTNPARGAFGIVAVLFAPGYAAVALLFPRGGESGILDRIGHKEHRGDGTVTVVERFVLAVVLSVCLVPLIGLGFTYTPLGVDPSTYVGAVGVATVALVVVAALRRLSVPVDDRFDSRHIGAAVGGLVRTKRDGSVALLNVVLIVGLVVAAAGMGLAVVTTERGEQFTEFYIVTEDPETGADAAAGYPDDGADEVRVGITNEEGETTTYSVVVLLQAYDGEAERSIRETRTVDGFEVTLEPGETEVRSHTLDPAAIEDGSDLRATYLLYRGSPPDETSLGVDTAYRHTHFWIDDRPTDAE